jgi:hypothetical protein
VKLIFLLDKTKDSENSRARDRRLTRSRGAVKCNANFVKIDACFLVQAFFDRQSKRLFACCKQPKFRSLSCQSSPMLFLHLIHAKPFHFSQPAALITH